MPPPVRSSRASSRFNESTHLIPSPDGKRPPRFEPLIMKVWVAGAIAAIMIALAVGVEVVLSISQRNGGFPLPAHVPVSFVTPQFLSSFFPTLLVIPLVILWNLTDWMLKWYQPYVTLSREGGSAEETLLLDYIAVGKLQSVLISYRHKHWIIFVSALTGLASFLLQPLAGAVISIQQMPNVLQTSVASTRSIALVPDVATLSAFVAAAGFAEAAVFHGLPDPPFVRGGWATAEFSFPAQTGLNGSATVTTQGIQTNPNCAIPITSNLTSLGNGSFVLNATSSQVCSASVMINGTVAGTTAAGATAPRRQYGVVNLPDCGTTTADVALQPVMFWFYMRSGDDGSTVDDARAVFCRPTIAAFMVNATVDLNDRSVQNVIILRDYIEPNNVTGDSLNGRAFNGAVFAPSDDPFVEARASTIRTMLPGTIFRLASQQPGGAASTFSDPQGFLRLATTVYRQHLSITAKSIYFVRSEGRAPATVTSQRLRVIVEPISGHGLAVTLFLIGLVGLAVHTVHKRIRRMVHLTSPPGSIAGTVALTARSGFGELLVPYDTPATMKRKLEGLHFRLDPRTGAIVADEVDYRDDDYRGGDERLRRRTEVGGSLASSEAPLMRSVEDDLTPPPSSTSWVTGRSSMSEP